MAVRKVKLSDIERIEFYVPERRMTIAQAYSTHKYNNRNCDLICNGTLFSMDIQMNSTITYGMNNCRQVGYLFDLEGIKIADNKEISWGSIRDKDAENVICGTPRLIKNGKVDIEWGNKVSPYLKNPAIRTAIGFNDNEFVMCTSDYNNTIEDMSSYILKQGCTHACLLDGGGSTSMIETVNGKMKYVKNTSRALANFVMIWLKKDNKKEEKYMKKQQTITVIDGDSKRVIDTQSILDEGSTYLPIRKLGEAIGYDVNYDSSTGKITLVKKSNECPVAKKESVITIDTGHSVQIPGASGFGLKEEEVCFKIGKKLGSKLQQKRYAVKYVRNDINAIGGNGSSDLNKRCDIINASKCDLVVSIHNNAYSDPNSNGIETLVYSEDSKDSVRIGKSIQSEMIKASGLKDRGIKYRSDLAILRRTTMDAVLLEIGFITNKKENELLRDDKWLDKIVDGIVIGIEKEVK